MVNGNCDPRKHENESMIDFFDLVDNDSNKTNVTSLNVHKDSNNLYSLYSFAYSFSYNTLLMFTTFTGILFKYF